MSQIEPFLAIKFDIQNKVFLKFSTSKNAEDLAFEQEISEYITQFPSLKAFLPFFYRLHILFTSEHSEFALNNFEIAYHFAFFQNKKYIYAERVLPKELDILDFKIRLDEFTRKWAKYNFNSAHKHLQDFLCEIPELNHKEKWNWEEDKHLHIDYHFQVDQTQNFVLEIFVEIPDEKHYLEMFKYCAENVKYEHDYLIENEYPNQEFFNQLDVLLKLKAVDDSQIRRIWFPVVEIYSEMNSIIVPVNEFSRIYVKIYSTYTIIYSLSRKKEPNSELFNYYGHEIVNFCFCKEDWINVLKFIYKNLLNYFNNRKISLGHIDIARKSKSPLIYKKSTTENFLDEIEYLIIIPNKKNK